MWQYLEESHIDEYRKAKEESKDSESSKSEEVVEPESGGQLTLEEVFQAKNPYPRNSACWKTLTIAVCFSIAKDMHPYQTVGDLGFQCLLYSFHHRHHPPDRKTVSTKLIPKLYDSERECVNNAISNVGHFALTTDIWRSHHNQAYIGLTIHYVDNSYKLQ